MTKSGQLCIIIRQEHRQEYRNHKSTSHADYKKCAEVFTSVHSFYPIPRIYQKYEAWQVFHCLWYWRLLHWLGLLGLHQISNCCISLFRQLDIAIYSLCIFVAVGCDRIIHIGKFCENWDELVNILLVIIKARLQGGADSIGYKACHLSLINLQWGIWLLSSILIR